jgi:hypothetical protein
VIDKGLIFNGLVFATHRHRGLYIGTSLRHRPQWLKDHPKVWETIEDAERRDACPTGVEIGGELSDIRPKSGAGDDIQDDSNDPAKVDDLRSEGLSSSDQTSLPEAPSPAIAPLVSTSIRDGVIIEGRRYVSAEQLASRLGISPRTLSRWCKERVRHRKPKSVARSSSNKTRFPNGGRVEK